MFALVSTADERFVEIKDVPDPSPADDDVLVSVKAISLNRGELALLHSRPAGWRPGQDVAGSVLEPSRHRSDFVTGDRVVGYLEGAGWAQTAAVKSSRLARIPDEVDFESAATLPIAGLTALRTLRLGGELLGRRVLVTGADGGVGQFAIQLAAHAGAWVTAIAKKDSFNLVKQLGAHKVLASIEGASELHHVVLESVGGASLEAAIRWVAPNGTIVSFGNSSGEKAPIDLFAFFGHENARIVTSFSYAYPDDGSISRDLSVLLGLLAGGHLKAPIASRNDWRKFAVSAQRLRDRRLTGKAVFTVN